MRVLILTVACLALPALALAQQAGERGDLVTPTVQLEQTTPPAQATPAAVDIAEVEAFKERPAEAKTQTLADDAAVLQDPTTARWWWLVGAIVLAGIILAAIR
jgi:cytochrome c-type biogenesis protein CcmH/NrfG